MIDFFDVRRDVRDNKVFLLLRISHLEKKFLEYINGNMEYEVESKYNELYGIKKSDNFFHLEKFKVIEKYGKSNTEYFKNEKSNMFYIEICIETPYEKRDVCLVTVNTLHCHENQWNDLLEDTPGWKENIKAKEEGSLKNMFERIIQKLVDSEDTKRALGLGFGENFSKMITNKQMKFEQILTYGNGFYPIYFDKYLMEKEIKGSTMYKTKNVKF